MINHIATGLANATLPYGTGTAEPCDVLLDASFKARRLPPWLQHLHNLLLPPYLSEAANSLRLANILKLIEGSSIVSLLETKDSRVLIPELNESAIAEKYQPHVTTASGSKLVIHGSPTAVPGMSDLFSYTVISSGSGVVVTAGDKPIASYPAGSTLPIEFPEGIRGIRERPADYGTWYVFGRATAPLDTVTLDNFLHSCEHNMTQLCPYTSDDTDLALCRQILMAQERDTFINRIAAAAIAVSLAVHAQPRD